MTQPLYLSYTAQEGERRWGLSIHLESESHEGTRADRLRGLHSAVDVWRSDHPEVFLQSDLGIEREQGCTGSPLSGYLYSSGQINGARLGRHLSMLRETGLIHRFVVRPGSVLEDADLLGRLETLEQLREILRSGSCHLRAPRRYGKTSLLRKLVRSFGEQGQPCVFVDVSDSQRASAFLLHLARAAVETPACCPSLHELPGLSKWPGREVGPIERSRASQALQEEIERSPWSFAGRLLEALGRLGAVLVIDEISVFLRSTHERDPQEARQLLELLAHSRRGPAPTRQVFAGSAGLSNYIRFFDLAPSLEGLTPLDVLPLSQADGAILAEELLYGAELTPSPQAVSRMLEVVGEPIPYFLHALAGAVVEENPHRSLVTPDMVDRAYSQRILGDRGNNFFRIYRIGDQPYPVPLRRAAARLLTEIARAPEGSAEETLKKTFLRVARGEQERFEPLLACLQEDFDLILQGGRWRIRSKVLRERWALGETWLTELD